MSFSLNLTPNKQYRLANFQPKLYHSTSVPRQTEQPQQISQVTSLQRKPNWLPIALGGIGLLSVITLGVVGHKNNWWRKIQATESKTDLVLSDVVKTLPHEVEGFKENLIEKPNLSLDDAVAANKDPILTEIASINKQKVFLNMDIQELELFMTFTPPIIFSGLIASIMAMLQFGVLHPTGSFFCEKSLATAGEKVTLLYQDTDGAKKVASFASKAGKTDNPLAFCKTWVETLKNPNSKEVKVILPNTVLEYEAIQKSGKTLWQLIKSKRPTGKAPSIENGTLNLTNSDWSRP